MLYLACRIIRCITGCGATTTDEYRQIEKDAALARRFQAIHVPKPSVPDTISILCGIKDRYKIHHGGIRISDAVLVAAAAYSNRYITDPDKAIDLVDEAASALRLKQESKPDALQQLDREIMTIQIELQFLRKETSIASRERREHLEETLKSKQNDLLKLSEVWHNQKDQIEAIKATKSLLDKARIELYQVQRKGDFKKASRITYSTIPELLAKLPKEESESSNNTNTHELMGHNYVTVDDIAAVVSKTTGIPLNKVQSGDRS